MATAKGGAGVSNGAGQGGGSDTAKAGSIEASDATATSGRSRRQGAAKEGSSSLEPRKAPASEPVNSIRPSRRRGRAQEDRPEQQGERSDTTTETRSRTAEKSGTEKPQSPLRPGQAEVDPWTVPASVRDRFQQDGHRFYFPDGAPAFRDHGRKLTTPSENTEVIHSLIEIAKTRGWQEITVGGTDRFRQEAWRQAKLEGLNVRGYRPSEAERASMIRSLARNREEQRAGTSSDASTANAESAPPIRESGTRPRSDRPRKDELIVGRLLDHRAEHYRFDPKEEMSYFVQIATPEGKRVVWGKDLSRALSQSLTRPAIGDEIGLRSSGTDSVTVQRRERDAQGQVTKETPIDTHRNRWILEKREFFDARASAAQVVRDPTIEPQRAVKDHPELAGTYLSLKAAEIAARAMRDPEDRKKFVALVRNAMADSIARGDPLQPVRVRERSATVPSRDMRAEREQELARG